MPELEKRTLHTELERHRGELAQPTNGGMYLVADLIAGLESGTQGVAATCGNGTARMNGRIEPPGQENGKACRI